ncbi:MAG: hypothetical protein JKY37_32540, partial [Nannocystaceae bacterium]|nr:hypothetical protein [Nannocystaceae bacterium]
IMVRLWGAKAGGEDTRGALYIWGDRGYQDQWFVPCPACTNLVEHGDLVICELAADTAALKSVGETYVDARGSELDGRFGGRSEHFGDTLSVESATASSSQMFWFDGWKGGGRDSKRYAAIRQSLLGLATQECDAVHRNQIETGGETAAADRPQRGPRDHLGVQ